MTVSEKKKYEDLQRKIESLTHELNELKKVDKEGFEPLETDHFLTQAYN
ncbi:hypothetical protein AB3N04_08675 [Alkalihalophilus sp. As8PL]|uniref:Uncharacterized protein n=1 Tax=Alkalihalophilus sp. As8PL TaxID=3237103 RepID=A0AB39BY53_9BACI